MKQDDFIEVSYFSWLQLGAHISKISDWYEWFAQSYERLKTVMGQMTPSGPSSVKKPKDS